MLIRHFFYCFKHSFDFNGRARRQEFWSFILFSILACLAQIFLLELVDTLAVLPYGCHEDIFLGIMFSWCALIPPFLAVSIRRLHDIGKSAWWLLLFFITPILICILVWFCREGQLKKNQYGLNPKGIDW